MRKILFLLIVYTITFSCNPKEKSPVSVASAVAKDEWVKPEGKDSILLLTDRLPNLETPMKYFLRRIKYSLFAGILPPNCSEFLRLNFMYHSTSEIFCHNSNTQR